MMQAKTNEPIAADFDRLRPYLLRVAYSHLGSLGDAEDVVQDAWLRLQRANIAEIRDLRGWLTTVVGRLALDELTSARARRERYVGPWLPEPVVEAPEPHLDPADRAELDESVSMAMLIVLEELSPAERCAFLLHDIFGYAFAEVADVVGRTPAATRQLATRARRAVEARRPRYPADADEQRAVVEAFLVATEGGDLASLLELLDPEVIFRSDGGGLVNAARKIFTGSERVAGILTAMVGHFGARFRAFPVLVNGAPGLFLETADSPSVIAFTLDRGRITAIDVVRNPQKLRTLPDSVSATAQSTMRPTPRTTIPNTATERHSDG